MFSFRTSSKGYKVSSTPVWYATKHIPERFHRLSDYDRSLSNLIGHIGPYPGDMARSKAGMIHSESTSQDIGDRESGLGRSWERLHMIGVSAGKLNERRYSKFNTLIGSHALNTAMIPMEGLARWVINNDRKFQYTVKVKNRKELKFITKDGNERIEMVPLQLEQAITYTSEKDDSIWITIHQHHTDWRVNILDGIDALHYNADVADEEKASKANINDVYAPLKPRYCLHSKTMYGLSYVFNPVHY